MESGEVVVEGDESRECYDRRTDKVEPEANIVQNVCGEINADVSGHVDFLAFLRRLLYGKNQNSHTLRQLIFAIRFARKTAKICRTSSASALYLRTYTLQEIFVEPGGTGKSGVWNRISCLTFMALLQ